MGEGIPWKDVLLVAQRVGALTPDSRLQAIADVLPDLIELAQEGIGYTSDYFRDKWEMDTRMNEILADSVVMELLGLNALTEDNDDELSAGTTPWPQWNTGALTEGNE